jgi:hypothetical protein
MLGTRKVVIYDGYKYHEEFGLSIVKFDVQPALAAALPTIFVERLFFLLLCVHLLTSSHRGLGYLANAHRHPRCAHSLRQVTQLHGDSQCAHV